ncbi:unnamed protein product [Clonostachys solani]|uniref:Zn(2)-C6 fungal-type domain-containing protein n=1 Tax=Clonostachys solani TaxID=160281 RepID=A0A9N9Z0Q2_9HYPO|nr:unnamed protein product [Clonostachys solani]
MVNRGRSTGCKTCKQRRVRCDEAKPLCRECSRLGYRCQGYTEEPLRLRFQVPEIKNKGKRQQSVRIRTKRHPVLVDITPPSPSPLKQRLLLVTENVKTEAVSTFLAHVAVLGRDFESTRGLLEVLVPALAVESPGSPLPLALNVAALQFWSMAHGSSASSPVEILSEANACLRSAIQDPVQRSREGTILAALLLQRYERLSATWNSHKPSGLHRNGALALLRQQQLDGTKSDNHGYLISQVLHIEVSACIRKKEPFPIAEIACMDNPAILPANPSTMLDTIGVSVANHQHKFSIFLSGDPAVTASTSSIVKWLESIRHAEAQLQQWPHAVPNHWHPRSVKTGKHINDTIDTFQGFSDVYPNIQIAAIWNVWRVYRVLLLRIRLRLLAEFPELVVRSSDIELIPSDISMEPADHDEGQNLIRGLVDSICNSVPFHLGNLLNPIALSDLGDANIQFPSYHDLDPTDVHYAIYLGSKYFMTRDDHRRHAIVQGSWQMLHTLIHLVDVFADESPCGSLVGFLRRGQVYWIRQQFLRVLKLLRLQHVGSSDNKSHHRTAGVLADYDPANVEIIATRVREALAR